MYLVKIFLVLTLLTSIFGGCNFGERNMQFKNNAYIRSIEISKNNLPKGLIDHFPSKIEGSFKMNNNYPNNMQFKVYYGSLLLNHTTMEQILKIKDMYGLYDSNKIALNDSCLFILQDHSNSSLVEKNKYCENRLIVIPDIKALILNDENEEAIYNSFDFYLIGSEIGIFLDDEYINALPNSLFFINHGYSKGIALNSNDEIMIFWGVVW
jgi:hypothetical protein